MKSVPQRKNEGPMTLPDYEELPNVDSPRIISAVPTAFTSAASGDVIDEDNEFEFSAVFENTEIRQLISADELFTGGKIRPTYPVFNRDLIADESGEKLARQPLLKFLIEERAASVSSPSVPLRDDLEGIEPGSYCIWKPGVAAQLAESAVNSPAVVRKSSSTGTSRRGWIRDLMVGRSYSDGKEKFLFLDTGKDQSMKKVAVDEGKKKGKGKDSSEVGLITAHRMFYGQTGTSAVAKGGGSVRRKSYLPYKPGIVGFFASVNGLSRTHHLF